MYTVVTSHKVAVDSPDHTHPWGTKRDNTQNLKFVNELIGQYGEDMSLLDFGCAGGQMVVDFVERGVDAVGIEGSDYSVKNNHPNWKKYHNKNLFTADFAKPLQIQFHGRSHKFNVITAWEVMEHFKQEDLSTVFTNIVSHLTPGGIFACSVSTNSDAPSGIELRRTRWHPKEWHKVASIYHLEPIGPVLSEQHYHYCFEYRLRGRTGAAGAYWTTMLYNPPLYL